VGVLKPQSWQHQLCRVVESWTCASWCLVVGVEFKGLSTSFEKAPSSQSGGQPRTSIPGGRELVSTVNWPSCCLLPEPFCSVMDSWDYGSCVVAGPKPCRFSIFPLRPRAAVPGSCIHLRPRSSRPWPAIIRDQPFGPADATGRWPSRHGNVGDQSLHTSMWWISSLDDPR
jgi:hypothetical protein